MTVTAIVDPVAAVLAESARFVGVQESPLNSNRGLEVDYFLREVGLRPTAQETWPWCAAAVHQVGRQALGAAWPVPRTASCQAIADWARRVGVLMERPEIGDLFLLWFDTLSPPRFGHVGFIVGLTPGFISTREGNASPASGSREGTGFFEKRRPLGPKVKFVHWPAALL